VDGFTKQYGVHSLVYFEVHADMYEAIQREKRLKKWNRAWKIRLIEEMNPEWKDLSAQAFCFFYLDPRPRLKRSGVTFLRGDDFLIGSPPSRGRRLNWVPVFAGKTS